jgi:hypothetical protein
MYKKLTVPGIDCLTMYRFWEIYQSEVCKEVRTRMQIEGSQPMIQVKHRWEISKIIAE